MLIALDVGNSSINIGFFVHRDLHVRRINTHPLQSPGGYASIIRGRLSEISVEKESLEVIISSVVKSHTMVLAEACKHLMPENLSILSPEIKTGLSYEVSRPGELGSDRIANAVAAFKLHKGPVAVVDFGTATTITVVGENESYIGGAIMPGMGLLNEALSRGTSKLKEVSLDPPTKALGTTTEGCIQSGLFYGTAGAIERLLQEIENETGLELKVFVTGGYGGMMSRLLRREHTLRPHLTLEGLQIIYMRKKNE
jgi:type III pantothenate kinase